MRMPSLTGTPSSAATSRREIVQRDAEHRPPGIAQVLPGFQQRLQVFQTRRPPPVECRRGLLPLRTLADAGVRERDLGHVAAVVDADVDLGAARLVLALPGEPDVAVVFQRRVLPGSIVPAVPPEVDAAAPPGIREADVAEPVAQRGPRA